MAKKKDFYKLAQLVKLAAKDVSGDNWRKREDVSRMLGFNRTDEEPDVLEITNDSGYRSIIIGDTRGNVSLNTKKRDDKIFHRGYAYLYSEQSSYKDDTEKWKLCYISFRSGKKICR